MGGKSEFAEDVKEAVASGKLEQPFRAGNVRIACPGWADGTYNTFLWKHCKAKPPFRKYFTRKTRGLYCLIK